MAEGSTDGVFDSRVSADGVFGAGIPSAAIYGYGASGAHASFVCMGCQAAYPIVDGITALVTAEELAGYEPFLAHYRHVRRMEGWVLDREALRSLPYTKPGAPYAALWRRRARAFERLLFLLRDHAKGRTLDILDLGAGNCWLSAQLARRAHRVEAVDINVDDGDGLGAAAYLLEGSVAGDAHSPSHRSLELLPGFFTRTQASLEHLPYIDCQFDVVVAAASLHYARDLAHAVAEAARVLRRGGALIVLDTPIYRDATAGSTVVARRIAAQRAQFGSDGAGITGPAYVERVELWRNLKQTGLVAREIPVHGALRALVGRLRRAASAALRMPERAQMPLVVAVKPGQAQVGATREAPGHADPV